ncbi:O-antigen ligase family protein [Nostoc sp. UHCC 0702]|nr:O-antigen ligase family protein [Nostoc sp. UHCC 0702]
MNININKKVTLLFFYRLTLAIASIFIFFTEIDSYLFSSGTFSFRPFLWLIVFCALSLPLFISKDNYLPHSMFMWGFGFIVISLLSFFLIPQPQQILLEELQIRISSVIFMLTMNLIFSKNQIIHLWTRRAALIAVLITVTNNIYQFFNPFAFNSPLDLIGRSSGFYLNPNKSGAALVIGMIFSVSLLQPKYRLPFVSIVGIGVLLTFSRSSLINFCVVLMLFIFTRLINRSQLLYWILFITTILIFLGSPLWEDILKNPHLSMQRVELIQQPFNYSDDSSDDRLNIALSGWYLFAKNPLLGNGIGSTRVWDMEISTHNTYLYYMADHGILGILMLPLLIYVVTRRARGETKSIGLIFTVSFLIWGLFSHNILDLRFSLIMFALMAAMTEASQLEPKSSVRNL